MAALASDRRRGCGWWAFDVYESQDAADAIGPPAIERLREMGVTEEPAVRRFEVHNAQPAAPR